MYSEFWCPADMVKVDPEGCGIGLAIGYFGVPVVAVCVLIYLLHLIFRGD